MAYAQSGRNVMLVDAGLRLPGVHIMFGLENVPGLTDLARSDELAIEDVLQATEVPGLKVLTAGTIPGNPAELLGSLRIRTSWPASRARPNASSSTRRRWAS